MHHLFNKLACLFQSLIGVVYSALKVDNYASTVVFKMYDYYKLVDFSSFRFSIKN